jgi:hypothetical protein
MLYLLFTSMPAGIGIERATSGMVCPDRGGERLRVPDDGRIELIGKHAANEKARQQRCPLQSALT